MGKPAARVGDMHTCPLVNPGPTPHVGGPVLPPGGVTVLIGGVPAARIGDMATCVGPPDSIASGSPTVLIGGRMAARVGDPTAHGGAITVGCPSVLIGEFGTGGVGSLMAATMAAAKMSGAPFTRMKCDKGVSPPAASPTMSEAAKGLFGKLSSAAKDLYHRIAGEKYSDGITIRGSKEFREKTRVSLNELGHTATGRKILDGVDELGRKGKRVTIVMAPDDFKVSRKGWFGGANKAFSKKAALDPTTGRVKIAEPGKGTSSELGYDPAYNLGVKNGKPCLSVAGALGHELLHTIHNSEGRNLRNFTDSSDRLLNSNHEEAQTIGRGAYRGDDLTENALRKEMGYTERTSHGDLCG